MTHDLFGQTNAYSISDVTAQIAALFDSEPAFKDVWVVGEVSNAKRAASGHWYFTLKDDAAQLRCVMFKFAAQRQTVMPEEGQSIKARGSLRVYEARGEYQLYVEQLAPTGGVGDLYAEFERLKAQLLAEGLFDAERKRPLPAFPRRIGVVTSPDAAAFRDVQNVLRRRYPLADVVLSPTLVQGRDAPPLIEIALERLALRDDIDVILLVRGGGSIEDLWSFNDERVARAVARCRVPVISGVGHETDTTIVDYVADHRAPTPSAAAEVATPSAADLRENLLAQDVMALRAVRARLEAAQGDLVASQRALNVSSPLREIGRQRQRLDELTDRVARSGQRAVNLLRERLNARINALDAANPDAILRRGYAIVRRRDSGQIVTQTGETSPGTGLTIRLQDGDIAARVEDEDTNGRYNNTLF